MRSKSGFTIVELLIVIVVIAILAAITVVAFNGVQTRANDSAVQSSLNQMYKKLKLAETSGDFSFDTEDEEKIGTLVGTVESNSYDTTNGFPLIIAPDYSWNDQGQRILSYSIAAVSKSGKVFFVNESTGGVAEAIADYERLRAHTESWLAMYQEWLNNEEYPPSDEDRILIQAFIAEAEARLATIDASELSGTYIWSLKPIQCEDERLTPARVCLDGETMNIPVNSDDRFSFAGYVYSPEIQAWRSIWGTADR